MDDDVKNLFAIIISGYAAIISTIALVWNIVNSILEKLSRIKVEAKFFDSFFGSSDNGEIIRGATVLSITITNASKKIKYINRPKLKLSYKALFANKKMDEVNLIELKNKTIFENAINFLLKLKPEFTVTLNYPLRKEGTEWFLSSDKDKENFKVIVTDTVNKKYYSKKIKINLLRNVVQNNSNIDDKIFRLTVAQYS